MFYSQIILAKKGPLGTVWQAAHWGDRKLGRPAIFATDISATVEHLTSSSSNSSGGGGGGGSAMVPMALRVSGHLLLGVVRIYSRQVQFLRDDCQQAMIKVKMAYSSTSSSSSSNAASSAIDLVPEKGGRGSHSRASHDTTNNSNSQSNSNSNSSKHQQALLNVSHFGEFLDDETLDFLVVHDHHGGGTAGGVDYHTGLPHNENAYYDSTSDDFFVDNNDDWVVPVDSHAQLGVGDPTMAAAVSNTNNNNNNDSMAPNMRDHNDTEEWGVFDPDDDAFATADSEDEEQVEKETNSGREEQRQSELSNKENRKEDEDDSLVSDVELTRAANTSTASDPSGVLYRSSLLGTASKGGVSVVAPGGGGDSISDAEFPQGGDDHDPFGDDTNNDMLGEDDDDSANRFRRRQSLQLSLSTHDGGSAAADEDVAGISFGSSLDASAVNNSAAKEIVLTGTKRRLSVRAGRRPNKRPRKVTTDSNHTELANEFIRTMLADTDDICREDENVIPTNETHDNADHDAFLLLYTTLSPTQLVCRPALADDGSLSNPLLKLWARNCNPVVGRPWDYASNDTDDVLTNGNAATIAAQNNEAASAVDTETETANKSKGDKSNGDDDDSSMEQARRGEGEEVEDFGRNGDDGDFPFADEDDAMRPEVDEEDRADNDPFEGNDKPLFDFDDDQDVRVDDSPVGNNDDRSIDSVFSLGATNGLDDVTFGNNSTNDNEGDERDDTTTTTTKWHRNTLKVFDVLKKNLGNADDSEHSVKETVSYNELTVGVSRRTAVGLFFELLQLKTLNYIELNQGESFGDITVSAGVKFMEEPPSA